MFLHNFKYEFITAMRNKDFLFWLVLFPIVLGAFFKIAFADIYEKTEIFHAVPVAVVQNSEDEIFKSVMEQVSGEDGLFEVTYCDEEQALEMLRDEDIKGIIYTDDLSLTVSGEGIEQTIAKSFLDRYKTEQKIIIDTLTNEPAKLGSVVSSLTEEVNCNENIELTDGNMDVYIQYFYNLIAMVALFGSITGLHIAMQNQGNLSQIGARKCCSPTPKLLSLVAALLGSFIAQSMCIVVSVSYLAFVLKVDFGGKLAFVYLSGIIGGIMGVSMGFFIGSFGRMGENAKVAAATTISMISCFLSGLMVGEMKALVAEKAPWFNKINPAAVISDTFYCLNIYDDYRRYTEKIITMLIMTVIFAAGGFLLTRRRKYASL